MARSVGSLGTLLVEHGVPERASRLYLSACREGPQTVAELARLTGLHRVEAYRHIRDLELRGILRSTGGRPKRFIALPIDRLVDRWIRRAGEKLDRLRSDRERVVAEWREKVLTPDPADTRKFAVLEGRTAIQRLLKRRFGAARKEILLSLSGFSLAPGIEGAFDRALAAARTRGVRVRLVTDIGPTNATEARLFASVAEVRHAEGPVTNRAIVIDREGALIFVSGEEGLGSGGDDQVALWSSAPSVLKLAREYHHRLWAGAIPVESRLVELERPSAVVLPVVRGKESEAFNRLKEITQLGMRATGLPRVNFRLPELIETVGAQMGREIATQVEGTDPDSVARALSTYYDQHALGRLETVRSRPLTLKVTQCFACTPQGPEIGRVLCPRILRSVLETRLGSGWSVSAPDPRRHATRGCVFTATPA